MHILAAKAEEENVEQEDMAYTTGSFSLPSRARNATLSTSVIKVL
jgi:hypothetical protein